MVVSVALAVVVLVLSFALLPQLFSVANDEDYARTTGLSVRFYNVLISVLVAVTVSVASLRQRTRRCSRTSAACR